jgi:alanine-synthesizing transaminase
MPQMKLAWIVINGPEEERIIARERLELICDTYLSVGTPVQQALPGLLRIGSGIREYLLQRARANLFSAARILQGGPAHVLVCEAGWSAIVRLPATQSEEVWTLRLLSECGILVQPGYFFDMESEPYVVISLITPPEAFEHGISCIAELAQHN